LGEVVGYPVQLNKHVLLDDRADDVGKLKADGVDQELALCGDQGVEKEAGLRPDVSESRADGPQKLAARRAAGSGEEAFANGLIGLLGKPIVEGVGTVGRLV
jgi:hypothetical protein